MGERRLRIVAALTLVLAAGCAPKMTTQQALVQEAFDNCQAQGPSTRLERVDRDGRFSVVGREGESQRVHDCMVRYAAPSRPLSATPAPRPSGLLASRLPGTWRGTLRLSPPAGGPPEVAGTATVHFALAAGALRWTLAASPPRAPLAADGTAVVVDNELRMTGTMRASSLTNGMPIRSNVAVRYAGAMVGDRLEVTGVTTDKQVHVLSIRRVAE